MARIIDLYPSDSTPPRQNVDLQDDLVFEERELLDSRYLLALAKRKGVELKDLLSRHLSDQNFTFEELFVEVSEEIMAEVA